MSNVTRKGLQFIVNQIGNAKYAFKDLVGDNVLNRGLIQKMDSISVKLRGSKYFNDYDLCNKDIYGINNSTFATYNTSDNLNITLQGGELKVDNKISAFNNFGFWTPANFNVPSLEGWNVLDYNAWSNYIPKYNASGTANTNYLIYNIYSEPNSGAARTSYSYPVRYNGSSYERVPLFNYAKWISSFNDTGSTKDEVHLIVPASEFSDLFRVDPYSGLPLDLALYSHANLTTNTIGNSAQLDGAMGIQNVSDEFERLAFDINLCDEDGNNIKNLDHYFIKINLPASMNFINNRWCHVAFYWGTYEDYFKTGYPSYSSGTAATYVPTELNDRWYTFPKISYFRKELLNFTSYDKTGVNDLNVYLYSANKTFYQRIDGQYISESIPFRYRLDENIEYSGSGLSSNINFNLSEFEYLPFIVASKNNSYKYDNPKNDYFVFYSSPVPANEAPSEWKDYELFPVLDEDYDIIAKIVVTSSSLANYNTPSYISDLNFVNNKVSIIYLESVIDNSIRAPIGDEDVYFYFYNALVADSNSFKNVFFDNILDTLNFALSVPAARMNTTNIKTPFVFKNENQNYYLQFHNLLKFPTSSLLASTSDPKAITFTKNGVRALSDWNFLSPSNDFAYINTSNSYISELKINLDNEFEIYQENTSGYNISDINDTGNKLGKDYSFKIKFEDTSFSYLTKELFINSTKYLLTDSDYSLRKNQNLSMYGYYKKGTYTEQQNVSEGVLQNIDDFRVYGYSKVIPDLEMGVSRTILTQEVEPVNSNKITREVFIAQLKATNSAITEDQINLQIQNYLLTSSFYVPDSNKYSNKFAEIKSVGVTISDYSTLSSKWIDNSSFMWGENIDSKFKKATHISDLRNDSFLIASGGFAITNNNLDILENIGDYKIALDINSGTAQTIQNGSKKITTEKIAFRVNPNSVSEVSSFRVKMLSTSIFNNNTSYASCEIWDSYSGLPNTSLAYGSKVYIDTLINTYDDYEFNISYKFHEFKDYWVVLNFNNNPPSFDTSITGKINVNDSSITGIYNRTTDSYTNFTKYQTGSELGIGSTLPSFITNWFEISSIGSSKDATISGSGVTLLSQDYSIRYNFKLGIQESSIAATSPYNIAELTSSGWALTQGTAYFKFYKPDVNIYGGFNKNFENNTNILPKPNRYRENLPDYYVDDYWSWNIEKINLPNSLYIYPKSTNLEHITVAGYGTVSNSYVEIKSSNWNNKILSGLGLTTQSILTSGCAITGIGFSSASDTYLLHINQVVPFSFDQNVFIGATGSTFINRSEDINVKIRYLKNGVIQDKLISLQHSPTWNTYYYIKNAHTYNHLDKNIICDLKQSSYNLELYNYDVNGTQNYICGYSKANFTAKSSIGSSFEFRFISSGGLRVYLGNNTLPSIDKWRINGSTSTCEFETETSFDLEVQFWNKTTLPILTGQWRISGSGDDWQNVDNSFYSDFTVEPILIDEDIQQISYMTVSNNAADLDTQSMGIPPGDRFVIRSK